MNVSVIGAGIAGLAATWHLLQNSTVKVTVYDAGGGASLASTGLLYPFPGRMAANSWLAKEGMAASRHLLSIAETALGRPVASYTGVLRLPWAEWQKEKFLKRIKKDTDAIWKNDGMWVESGVSVFAKPYLEGLRKACENRGAKFIQARIDDLAGLDADRIILATGSETNRFSTIPFVPVKGQALLCRWKSSRLPYSLASNGHITLTEDPDLCLVGSTYETEFSNRDPDRKIIPELIEKAAVFYHPARDFEVLEVLAGVRMMPPEGYRPIIQKIDEKTWVFSGLGSRGLLYHAILGEHLAQEVIDSIEKDFHL